MQKKHINFREAHESEYGLAYLQPYMDQSPDTPMYLILEQLCREHEMYKGMTEHFVQSHKQLDKIEKEVHYTLLRSGDSEKSSRALLQCWNTYFCLQNVQEAQFLGLKQMVAPPLKKALEEVNDYYAELSKNRRSRMENTTDEAETHKREKNDERNVLDG